MSDFKCIRAFTSETTGRHFRYGQEISQSQYSLLRNNDQRNFEEIEEEEDIVNSSLLVASTLSSLNNIDTSNFHDGPIEDPAEDNDFGGFGDGDTGGAGATGDW